MSDIPSKLPERIAQAGVSGGKITSDTELHARPHQVLLPLKQSSINEENKNIEQKIQTAKTSAPTAKDIQEINQYKEKTQYFIKAIFEGWKENNKSGKSDTAQEDWVIQTVDAQGKSIIPQVETLPAQAGRLPVFSVKIALNMEANKLTVGKGPDFKNEDHAHKIASHQFFNEYVKFNYERETMLFGKGNLNTMSDRYDIHMKFESVQQVRGELYKNPAVTIYFIPKTQ